MKRKYITPVIHTIVTEPESMLCTSPGQSDALPSFDLQNASCGNAEDAASKDEEHSLWSLDD